MNKGTQVVWPCRHVLVVWPQGHISNWQVLGREAFQLALRRGDQTEKYWMVHTYLRDHFDWLKLNLKALVFECRAAVCGRVVDDNELLDTAGREAFFDALSRNSQVKTCEVQAVESMEIDLNETDDDEPGVSENDEDAKMELLD